MKAELWMCLLGELTSLHLLAVLGHVVRADGPEEFDVIIAVVLGHLLGVGLVRTLQGQQGELCTHHLLIPAPHLPQELNKVSNHPLIPNPKLFKYQTIP